MKIKNDSTLPIPSEERIESFEDYCGIKLPTEFKDFLRKSNGAIPVTNVFSYNDREYVVERFLCLLDEPQSDDVNGWYDIEVVLSQIDTRLTDDEDLVGANIIPFAALFAGDFVCMDFRNDNTPSVLVWFHEESEDFNPVTVEVAESINEFFDMLKG
ncbi:SMI1/KNR4 family protein [Marinisporobacter balticus]|uniref:SUKH superfamily protein n=1 Tax=Marinisporobacter balticus TaxID=2018667 RepID=A0A4R2K6R5_9FIRM|nr:SMI1/KNR4 family protein [Marinisporobacter balticus]TCO68981.1 SUKH superfamily protein [Marinisporobacter balticus]